MKVEEYPEKEKYFPYDPLGNVTKTQLLNMYSSVESDFFYIFHFPEFEKYNIPEDMCFIGGLALPGLACFPPAPHLCEEDLDQFEPLPNPSPVMTPKRSGIVMFEEGAICRLSASTFVLICTVFFLKKQNS